MMTSILSKILKFSLTSYYSGLLFLLAINTFFFIDIFGIEFLNFNNVNWIYASGGNIRDDAGHAIASLFYSNEPWGWPLGAMSSLGGDVAGSIMYFATSPIYAIPFKALHSLGIFGDEYQFIGLQVYLGMTLTNISIFYVCNRIMKARVLTSITIALISMFLCEPLIRWTNESLASQFIVVLAIAFSLRPSITNKRCLSWGILAILAVGINQYFVPLVFAMAVAEWLFLYFNYQESILEKSRNLICVIGVVVISNYVFGGFEISPGKLGTGTSDLSQFSSNLLSFFDSRGYGFTKNLGSKPSWESFNYLGVSALLLGAIFLFVSLKNLSRKSYFMKNEIELPLLRVNLDGIRKFSPIQFTVFISTACFLISLGPTIGFGSKILLTIPFPDMVLELYSTFRALARFAWPLFFVIIILLSKTLDRILTRVTKLSGIPVIQGLLAASLCIVLVGIQARESAVLIEAMRSVAQQDLDSNVEFSDNVLREFRSSSGIKVIPPFDGDVESLPWREISGYVLKSDKELATWGFFARYDAALAGEIQQREVVEFQNCRVAPNTIFLARNSILDGLACKLDYAVIKQYGDVWTLIKS
jgi:hypothetical protein